MADQVLVLFHESQIARIATLSAVDGVGSIGLIAVKNQFLGKKLGRQLIQDTLEWVTLQKYRSVRVVTQGDNIPACRLYKSTGFKKIDIKYLFHIWL